MQPFAEGMQPFADRQSKLPWQPLLNRLSSVSPKVTYLVIHLRRESGRIMQRKQLKTAIRRRKESSLFALY
jgi:hypothetical protein